MSFCSRSLGCQLLVTTNHDRDIHRGVSPSLHHTSLFYFLHSPCLCLQLSYLLIHLLTVCFSSHHPLPTKGTLVHGCTLAAQTPARDRGLLNPAPRRLCRVQRRHAALETRCSGGSSRERCDTRTTAARGPTTACLAGS